jgi:hypothetical protein
MPVKKGRIALVLLLVIVALFVIAGQLALRIPGGAVLEMSLNGRVAEEDWPSFET